MKKPLIIFALAWLTAATCRADDYGYVVFQQSSGTLQSVDAQGLKITFRDGQLIATPKTGEPLAISLEDMAAMRFSTEAATGISSATAESGISMQGRAIVIALPSRNRATVATPSGVVVAQYATAESAATFATQPLASGVYIVKTNNTTTKILVR